MSLPYFTRGKRVFDRGMPDGLALLLYPDAVERLSSTIARPLSDLPPTQQKSLLSGLQFAMGNVVLRGPSDAKTGDHVWKEVIETYFELLKLVVPLGHADALYELYLEIMEPLAEAQQELYNWERQIESLAEADVEVQYNAHMQEYMALYEGLVKATMAFPVYCLDLIAGGDYDGKRLGKDLGKKDHSAYVHDDLSYKRSKVEEAESLGLRSDLSALLVGVEPHIRNAIAHKRFEYTESGGVTFRDIDRKKGTVIFERTMTLGAFKLLTKTLKVNFMAQGAALTLFPFEYGDRVRVRPGVLTKPKALKAAIYHLCQEAQLEPTDIRIEGGHLRCDLYRSSALDSPSSFSGNLAGVRFRQDLPPLPLKDQLLHLGVRLAEHRTPIATAELRAVDHDNDLIGYVKVDVTGLSEAMAGPPFPPIETFIIESDFGGEGGGEQENADAEE